MTTTPGRFCLPLADGHRHFNTLTHTVVKDHDDECMIAGQERAAILKRLLTLTSAYITTIASFECNLRCPQCYVGDMLKRPTGSSVGNINPDHVIDLMTRIKAYEHPEYGKWSLGEMCFLGGEPLLHPDFMRTILDRSLCPCTVTTNGVWNFDEVSDILNHPKMRLVTFSIDGLPEHHNNIRKSLTHEQDTFGITYRNMARMRRDFPNKTIIVQGSTVNRQYTPEEHERWYALMLLAGIPFENIRLSVEAPTVKKAATEHFMDLVGYQTRGTPCCDYLFGKQIVVYRDELYASYFSAGKRHYLGKVTDNLTTVLDKYRDHIIEHMPMLSDDVCMNECKAVGVCWGHCANVEPAYSSNKPSSICNRQFKESILQQVAERQANGKHFSESVGDLIGKAIGVPSHV